MNTKLILGIAIALLAAACGSQPTSIYAGTNVERPAHSHSVAKSGRQP